jgi:hypothetical protein
LIGAMATHNLDHFPAAQRGRLRTPRGITAAVLTAIFVVAAASGSRDPGGSLIALLVFSPVGWWFWWWTLGFLARLGHGMVRGEPPKMRVGRAWQPSSSAGRQQLRQDGNARVFADRGGILLRKRRWFIASGTSPVEIPEERWQQITTAQSSEPQYMASFRERSYWWYADVFYWTNGDYSAEDIKALLFTRQRQQERELDHAHAVLAASASPARRKREPIPKDVKLAVWARDEGRCVECDSDFDIQYDHIIPFSMGGASTVENLQLLCARCNQVKGGRL